MCFLTIGIALLHLYKIAEIATISASGSLHEFNLLETIFGARNLATSNNFRLIKNEMDLKAATFKFTSSSRIKE